MSRVELETRLRKSIGVFRDPTGKWRITVNAVNGPSLHSGDDEVHTRIKYDNLIKSLVEIVSGDYESEKGKVSR